MARTGGVHAAELASRQSISIRRGRRWRTKLLSQRGETIFFGTWGIRSMHGDRPLAGQSPLPLAFPFSRPAFQPGSFFPGNYSCSRTRSPRVDIDRRLPKRVQRERDTFHVLKKILLLRTQKQPTKNLPGAKPLSVFHLASSLCDGTSLSFLSITRARVPLRALAHCRIKKEREREREREREEKKGERYARTQSNKKNADRKKVKDFSADAKK